MYTSCFPQNMSEATSSAQKQDTDREDIWTELIFSSKFYERFEPGPRTGCCEDKRRGTKGVVRRRRRVTQKESSEIRILSGEQQSGCQQWAPFWSYSGTNDTDHFRLFPGREAWQNPKRIWNDWCEVWQAGERERVLYWQPTGPNPLYHRDD